MVKIKAAEKHKKKAFLAFSIIGLSFLLAGSIFSKAVPQNMGFKDVKYTSLTKEVCQECHSGSLADTHHNTNEAVSGNCVFCHSVQTESGNVGVSLERNCMVCHQQSPHHATKAAQDNQCRTCHDGPGVSDYSTEVPSYAPSIVTPKPSDCGLCHGEGVVDGLNIVGPRDTHHGISLKECTTCHGEVSTNKEENEQSMNIRLCERCHNVKVLHEVTPHVEKDSCVVCHGGKTVTATAQPETQE